MRTTIILLAFTLTTLSGCYAAHEAGSTPGRDGGPIVFVDAGPAPTADGGPIARDAGGPGPTPASCRTEIIDRYAAPMPCSEAVNECIRRCAETGAPECPNECIASEPECQRCFFQNVVACSNDLGCLDRWRDFACCTSSVPVCSDLTGIDRFGCAGECGGPLDDYSACIDERGGDMCLLDAIGSCGVRLEG